MEGSVKDLASYRLSTAEEDFYVVSKDEAKKQIQNAELIVGLVEKYSESKL